jgi:hypothetical protein
MIGPSVLPPPSRVGAALRLTRVRGMGGPLVFQNLVDGDTYGNEILRGFFLRSSRLCVTTTSDSRYAPTK